MIRVLMEIQIYVHLMQEMMKESVNVMGPPFQLGFGSHRTLF